MAHETQEVRHSREDLSLEAIGTGPVTVFSSQKKLNDVDEIIDDTRRHFKDSRTKNREEDEKEIVHQSSRKQQFYFGMSPGDVAVATAEEHLLRRRAETDLEEESRRVMEEFDAILADKKPDEPQPITSNYR